jgi:uridine kinase
MIDDISKYVTSPEEAAWILAIKGDPGSGKSLLIRNLLHSILNQEMAIVRDRNQAIVSQASDRYPQKI